MRKKKGGEGKSVVFFLSLLVFLIIKELLFVYVYCKIILFFYFRIFDYIIIVKIMFLYFNFYY